MRKRRGRRTAALRLPQSGAFLAACRLARHVPKFSSRLFHPFGVSVAPGALTAPGVGETVVASPEVSSGMIAGDETATVLLCPTPRPVR